MLRRCVALHVGLHRCHDELTPREAAALLEMTRQLAARLASWQGQVESILPLVDAAAPRDMKSRRLAILTFIHQRHRNPLRLADLAAHLHLSEDRASHAVREACGRPFIHLLIEARVEAALALLRHTELAVVQIARHSGFRDYSHFHQVIQRHARCSPLRYRAKSRQRRSNLRDWKRTSGSIYARPNRIVPLACQREKE